MLLGKWQRGRESGDGAFRELWPVPNLNSGVSPKLAAPFQPARLVASLRLSRHPPLFCLSQKNGGEAGSSSLNIYIFSFEGPFALTLMKFKEEIHAKRQGHRVAMTFSQRRRGAPDYQGICKQKFGKMYFDEFL